MEKKSAAARPCANADFTPPPAPPFVKRREGGVKRNLTTASTERLLLSDGHLMIQSEFKSESGD
jgi:hypothetical protein